ncbi:hypothetical protein [Porphyromonas pogonae]|nr:hypothetical protein [Porphyromonas pogonae]
MFLNIYTEAIVVMASLCFVRYGMMVSCFCRVGKNKLQAYDQAYQSFVEL